MAKTSMVKTVTISGKRPKQIHSFSNNLNKKFKVKL